MTVKTNFFKKGDAKGRKWIQWWQGMDLIEAEKEFDWEKTKNGLMEKERE